MKFGKYLENNILNEWRYFYIDYKKLKKSLKNTSSIVFYNLIELEIRKLNDFVTLIKNYENVDNKKISDFLVLNYMALFKSIKKHDKKLSKSTKIDFFNNISKLPFYRYYLSIPRKCNKIKLVIFDKDGTLINHEKIFGKWLIKIVRSLAHIINDSNKLFKFLGYDPTIDKFEFNSIIARGTNDDVRNSIYEYILNENSDNKNIKDLREEIKKSWIPIDFKKEDIIQCGNILNVFKYLKSKNIKIAVCTSDDREPTEKTLNLLNLNDYIDDVMCGDDPISSKPSPEPIWKICSNLDINIENTLMIGDTISDIHGGINAKCGKVVGVLSGSYDNVDLTDADGIIDSIDDLPSIIELIK